MRNKYASNSTPVKQLATSRFVILLICMAVTGAVLGIIGKLADAHTEHISNILSGMSFWIMLCTIISVRSGSPRSAAAYVLALCVPMVVLYYLTAEIFDLYYSLTFAYGWAIFALCTPILGCAAWYATGRSIISKLIACGIPASMLLITHVLFRIRIYDIMFALVTVIFLFKPIKT